MQTRKGEPMTEEALKEWQQAFIDIEESTLEMSPGREAACRAVFGTWGFFRTMHGKTAPSC